jgi:hypothetical protein
MDRVIPAVGGQAVATALPRSPNWAGSMPGPGAGRVALGRTVLACSCS